MTITIIKNKNELNDFIKINGDYAPELTYLSQDENKDCFALFGCSHASEAWKVSDTLVITANDYQKEINVQSDSENPELAGFKLR